MESPTKSGIPICVINPQFLNSNATSHKWPFSAIAELIDNAYDPDVSAKQLWINKTTIKGKDCLIFMDNGNGMDYDKMHKMLSLGYSDKQAVGDHDPVGRYGNGFKSGSMRLGKDAIVFSMKANTKCVGLLSLTYLERIEAKTVLVPIVMFTKTRQTVCAALEHAESLSDILTHSLFNTEAELLSEFTVIEKLCTNSSGTCIIIWNLHRELEFDFMKDPKDIRISDEVYKNFREPNKRQTQDSMSVPESDYSLRAYCRILYLNPRMEIILQGQKVEAQSITTTLAKVRTDTYRPECLKKKITITFGYNKKNMEHYGLMMYHKNRLIKAYVLVSCQCKTKHTGYGVIGVIECNHLKPIHNKQDFEDSQEYRNTMKNLNNKLEDYWKNNCYSYQAFNRAENTEERTGKLQRKKRKQSLVNPRPSMPVTPRPSDDTSVVILDTSISTTPKRKKELDLSREKSEKKARRKCFDKNIPELPALISSDSSTADYKDSPSDDSDVFKSIDSGFLVQQVMEASRQLQDKLRELKKVLKTEEVETKMDSLEYEKFTNCCESLQKDLEGIKIEIEKVKVTDEDYATPLKEASNPGREKDSQFQKWKDETQNISESLRFRELRQRMERLLVTFVPALDLEKVINQILSHDIDEISTTDLSFGKGNCTISTEYSHTNYHSAATDVFTPELVQHCAASGAYRFLCSNAGVFSCKMTNILFDMKRSGEVLYTVESWDNSQLQSMGQFKPAGPLYNIDCSEDLILYLHLPHCEIHTGKNKLELAVAHISEDNVEIIQPLNITSTHVIFEVHGLSIFGLLKKWIFSENPISAQVLLFYKEIIGKERWRKLHIHLLPGNVPVDKVQEKHQSNTYIQCSSLCQLTPGKKYRPLCEPYVSQPKVETFVCDFGPNYHSTFEVILNTEVENLTLGLLDETGQEVWEPRQVFLTDESREAVPVEMNEGAAFVDKHRDTLIQRVLPVLEIADTLLTKKHITHEMYNEIIEATTTENKMRILYRYLESGRRAVKADFYKILKEKQPDLVDGLNAR